MIERNGDLFSTKLDVIGHGVNTVGVMGAGVAKVVRDKFPDTYRLYVDDCKSGALLPGTAIPGNIENDKVIFNIASQELPGKDASYAWLAKAVELAVQTCKSCGIHSMAIPRIGCGIGGLEWEKVKKILVALENDYSFEFEVWTL